jgi:hypothetical protein
VTWPFLGQHNHPYLGEELGLNLKERTVIQLRVGLFESSVFKIWGRISVSLLFKARNVIGNLVIVGANRLGVDSEWRIDQQ